MNSAGIATLNALAASWGENMLRACWQGGLMILFMGVLFRLMPRFSPALQCLLWWLVCLRLLIGLVTAPISLTLLPAYSPLAEKAVPPRESNVPPGTRLNVFAASTSVPLARPSDEHRESSVSISLIGVVFCIWLIGAIVCSGSALLPWWSLRQLLAQAQPLDNPEIQTMAQQAAAASGLHSLPRLLVTSKEIGPLTSGVFSPVVLFSQSDLARLSETEIRLALAHEFAHIRRGDLWLGLLPWFAQMLFYFYPLAWIARREFDLSREAACDLRAMQATQTAPNAYADLLLKLGTLPNVPLARSALNVSSHYRLLQRRMQMLSHPAGFSGAENRSRVLMLILISMIGLVPWRLVRAQSSLDTQSPEKNLYAQNAALPVQNEDQETVTLDINGTNLPHALALIFDSVHSDYVLALYDDTENSLSSRFHQVPLDRALDTVLRSVGNTKPAIRQQSQHGIVSVVQEDFPAQPFLKPRKVSFRFHNTDLRAALGALFAVQHTSYRLKEPAATKVTASAKGLPFPEALDTFLRQCDPPLKAVREKDVTVLTIDRANPVPLKKPITPVPSETPAAEITKRPRNHIGLNQPFEEAMRSFFTLFQAKYRIDPSVPVISTPVSVEMDNVTLEEGLNTLLRSVKGTPTPLGFHQENGVYVIAMKTQEDGPTTKITSEAAANKSGKIQNLNLENVELGEALQQVFSQQSGNYILAEPVEAKHKITMKLQNVSVEEAVTRLQRSAEADPPLVYQDMRGIQILNRPRILAPIQEKMDKTRLTAALKDVSAYEALFALFSTTQANFALAGELKSVKLTVGMVDTPFHQALEQILAASPTPLKWSLQDGIYKVELK